MFRLASAALALALVALPATAQEAVNARAAANSIAQRVEENFFDAERGRSIAADLRARAERGEFDRFTNPLDLATAFTEILHPQDGHFAVVYRPDAPAAGPQGRPSPQQIQAQQGIVARANYGFRRVEMLPGGIGYILLDQFAGFDPNANPMHPARRAADAAMAMVADARAIIIDLRDSRGGSPAMVAYVASHFVPQGADIFNTFHSRRGTSSEAPVIEPTGGRRLEVPLYILVNGGSGSASESLPYTLQAARRATIVGETTNGRANPGGFLPTPEGFAVFVSGGTPVNPITHANWEGTGVVPDVAVNSADALTRAQELALQRLIETTPDDPATGEARAALEVLQTRAPTLNAQALAAFVGAYGERSIAVADGRLVVTTGRRRVTLIPLAADTFTFDGNPLVRVHFERDARGRVVAFEQSSPAGDRARFLRT